MYKVLLLVKMVFISARTKGVRLVRGHSMGPTDDKEMECG